MRDMERVRARMVDRQIAGRGVRQPHILDAMRATPREDFVPERMREFAYEDAPLPIEAGQTISQPYIVALMIEAAEIGPGDRVLEIGAGSGYAAAVMSRIASRVHAIERQPELFEVTRRRLETLGYGNVELRLGDGTRGWPEAAPFDAIVASAGGPEVPQTLADQLAIGGRLVMPVGPSLEDQRLIKVKRLDQGHFTEEDLGQVRFVPLIGEHGWPEQDLGDSPAGRIANKFRPVAAQLSTPEMMREAAEPLPDIDDPAFGRMFDRFGRARVVLLGEASHGTSEFYRARAAISRHLIEQHDFTIIAAEADWPDAATVDRYIRHRPPRPMPEPAFSRFPTWMWRNVEFDGFARWLREHNHDRADEERVAFYGLDLYSLNTSIHAVIQYLDRVDPEAAAVARERYGCLTPWSNEPQTYGRMALTTGYAGCEKAVTAMLADLLRNRLDYAERDGEDYLDAAQNAALVRNAEAYYRAIYYGAAESWNQRDRHMFETLERVLVARGPDAKAIVWAHNSHIGDARFTEMGVMREELNIGQLCRERFGSDCALIGFGTHSGTVAAADDWDGPMEVKRVRPALPDSYERLAHDAGIARCLYDLRASEEGSANDALRDRLLPPQLERFIGVIYRPDTERWSHYSECSLPRQFDAYVWFDETEAVTPLPAEQRPGPDETYPFGL